MVITEEQAIEQLYNMINPVVALDDDWDPFAVELDDYDVNRWVSAPDNAWCSGKREDFRFLLSRDTYKVGDNARAVLAVLGVYLKRPREKL